MIILFLLNCYALSYDHQDQLIDDNSNMLFITITYEFYLQVELPTLASLNLSSIASQTIWHNQLQPHSASFHNLTELTIYGCDNLIYLFPISVAESLNHLELIDISDCKLMEGVIITRGERKSSTLFPKLKQLNIDDLSNSQDSATSMEIQLNCPPCLN